MKNCLLGRFSTGLATRLSLEAVVRIVCALLILGVSVLGSAWRNYSSDRLFLSGPWKHGLVAYITVEIFSDPKQVCMDIALM